MGYCKLSSPVVWSEPGTTYLASHTVPWLETTNINWLVPNSVAGAVLTTATTANWFVVDTFGAEYMDLEFSSNLVALGALSATTTVKKLYLPAVGRMVTTGDALFDTPHAVKLIPSAVTEPFSAGTHLWCFPDGAEAAAACSTGNTVVSSKHGFFLPKSSGIANADVNIWRLRIGRKNTISAAGLTEPHDHFNLNGLTKVWFALGVEQTMTGGIATTYLKAELRLLLGRETISLGPG